MSLKKSRKSTSFRFTEIGSPVYLPGGAAIGETCVDCAIVPAAVFACWAACCAACPAFAVGRDASLFSRYEARVTEDWVSSVGNANRGVLIPDFLLLFALSVRFGVARVELPASLPAEVAPAASLKTTTTAVPSCESWKCDASVRSMTTRTTSSRNCPSRTPSTGAIVPAITVFCDPSLAPLKSSTNRSGFCNRSARASSFPLPSTRTLARCDAFCTMAPLEITVGVVVTPATSCACAGITVVPTAKLVRIKKPDRTTGQFVFIARLLHSCKFSCPLAVPPACQTRFCPLHGTSHRPSQSCLRARHTTDPLHAGSTYAVEDC